MRRAEGLSRSPNRRLRKAFDTKDRLDLIADFVDESSLHKSPADKLFRWHHDLQLSDPPFKLRLGQKPSPSVVLKDEKLLWNNFHQDGQKLPCLCLQGGLET